jgi:hypothetical protein
MFFGFLLIESWFSWRFLRKLRRDYPALWEKTGRWTIWTDRDLSSAWPTITLLWNRKYDKFCSTDEERLFFEGYRNPIVFSYVAAIVGGAAFFVCFLIFGWP